jgi:molybdate transport system substrate-binding protein
VRRRSWQPVVLVTVMALGAMACGDASATDPANTGEASASAVRIAAAADLRFALDELIDEYREIEPDVSVTATYGSSGTFYAQLTERAPFDLYLSADVAYPEQLAEQGLTVPGSTFVYAVGRIVVWAADDAPVDPSTQEIDALTDPAVRKIAIANPEHAPYGRAAIAAFASYAIEDDVAGRLVLGENVSQAAQFVESGAANVGVIALSLVLAPDVEGNAWTIPADRHPPIIQGGAIMAWAIDPDAARRFVDFLTGPEARATLDRYGFEPASG